MTNIWAGDTKKVIKIHEEMTFKTGPLSTMWVDLDLEKTTNKRLLKEDNRLETGRGTSKNLFRVNDVSTGP